MIPRSANKSSTSRKLCVNRTLKPDRLLDDFGREAVAAIADLGHHRWLRLKSLNGKPAGDVTMPLSMAGLVPRLWQKLGDLAEEAFAARVSSEPHRQTRRRRLPKLLL